MIMDVHIPCRTCGKLIPAGGKDRCLDCRTRSLAVTNADHLREALSSEDGMAKFLMKVHDEGIYIPFCQNKEECWDLSDENGVPEEKCMECMKEWMRKPYEGD
jgi:hypothetical protein